MSGYMRKYPLIDTQSAVIYTCGPTIWVSLLSFSDMLGCNPSDADPANLNPSDSSKKNSCRRPIGKKNIIIYMITTFLCAIRR
jgi:hypothetical protein